MGDGDSDDRLYNIKFAERADEDDSSMMVFEWRGPEDRSSKTLFPFFILWGISKD